VEALDRKLNEEFLPGLSVLKDEALKILDGLKSENLPDTVRREVEVLRAKIESFKAFREACLDAVKLWVIEAVRLHLPQTSKKWRETKHGFNANLDELLGFILSKHLLAEEKQGLHEWFKTSNPSQYNVLQRLLDPSENLEVFFRMVEKTVSEIPYLKVLSRMRSEIVKAEDLKKVLEAEKARLKEKILRLEEELLKK
jgi:hypothetical protein